VRTRSHVRVHVVTMGCAKNIVDSERLRAQLRLGGVELLPTADGADVVLVNTCGFIQSAKEESLEAIFQHVRLKSRGRLKRVFAMGCLTERYMEDLRKEIPEVDRFFGSHQMKEVLQSLGAEYREELLGERDLTTPPHTAYLKISEGCDHPCSFCAIPLMRGKHRSHPEGRLLDEAHRLAEKGVRELVVIGQDTTLYGVDVDGKRHLGGLLKRLGDLPGIEWVRLMYAFPARFPLEVLDVIADHPKICKYLDLPLQHVSDRVLSSMRRGMSCRALRELVATIRRRVPGIALRTTLIVGYPEEGEREFLELLDFVREARFERLGVFLYSHEDGTSAYPLGDPVPAEEKERRRAQLMEVQRDISEERNASLVGNTLRVLIDRYEQDHAVGRTEHDAPEIDNEVFVRSLSPLPVGSFCDVDIVEAYEYDIVGVHRSNDEGRPNRS
jgi:ribosomal protein S12 methylthiotransferase